MVSGANLTFLRILCRCRKMACLGDSPIPLQLSFHSPDPVDVVKSSLMVELDFYCAWSAEVDQEKEDLFFAFVKIGRGLFLICGRSP